MITYLARELSVLYLVPFNLHNLQKGAILRTGLQLTYYLAKVSPTCEQLPNVGGGQLPVSSECVCQVATDLKMKDKVDSISITPPPPSIVKEPTEKGCEHMAQTFVNLQTIIQISWA